MDEQTRRIHRLLSDGKFSVPEAEEILQKVLAADSQGRAAEVRALPVRAWVGAALAAAAAVLLVVNLPRDPGGEVRIAEEGDVPASGLRVGCEGGELNACPMSGKLVFEVTGKKVAGFLSAYAEPIGRQGEQVFYYSKEDGSVELPGGSAVRPIGLTKVGRYRVHAVIAERALTREELVRASSRQDGVREVRSKVRIEIVVTRRPRTSKW